MKLISVEIQKILDLKDNISLTYKKLEIIFKQEWSKLKWEVE